MFFWQNRGFSATMDSPRSVLPNLALSPSSIGHMVSLSLVEAVQKGGKKRNLGWSAALPFDVNDIFSNDHFFECNLVIWCKAWVRWTWTWQAPDRWFRIGFSTVASKAWAFPTCCGRTPIEFQRSLPARDVCFGIGALRDGYWADEQELLVEICRYGNGSKWSFSKNGWSNTQTTNFVGPMTHHFWVHFHPIFSGCIGTHFACFACLRVLSPLLGSWGLLLDSDFRAPYVNLGSTCAPPWCIWWFFSHIFGW